MHSAKRERGEIHYAKLKDSDRLRKVFNLLLLGPHTTSQVQRAMPEITNVPTAMCELIANGVPVIRTPVGRTREYSLPEGQLDFELKT